MRVRVRVRALLLSNGELPRFKVYSCLPRPIALMPVYACYIRSQFLDTMSKRISILAVAACFCAGPMPLPLVTYTDAFLVQQHGTSSPRPARHYHVPRVVSSDFIRATAPDPREVVIPNDFRMKKIRVRLTDAGSLEIQIPPVGIRRETQDGWFMAPVMTYPAVLFAWELRSIGRVVKNPGLVVFSTLWTVCDVALLKDTIWQYCRSTKLTVGTYTTILKKGKTQIEFPTASIHNVMIGSNLSINKKEMPAICLSTDQNKYSFGHGLPEREMQWLSQVIDAWLDAHQNQIKGGIEFESMNRKYDDWMIDDDVHY
jgi:hypothetical protein